MSLMKILHIEDQELHCKLLQMKLEGKADYTYISTVDELKPKLENKKYDVCILDRNFETPQAKLIGFQLVPLIRQYQEMPIIPVTYDVNLTEDVLAEIGVNPALGKNILEKPNELIERLEKYLK